jgi:hypothetical protein
MEAMDFIASIAGKHVRHCPASLAIFREVLES